MLPVFWEDTGEAWIGEKEPLEIAAQLGSGDIASSVGACANFLSHVLRGECSALDFLCPPAHMSLNINRLRDCWES